MILLEIVMVSPGTHLVKNHESQPRTMKLSSKPTTSKLKKLGSSCNQVVTESEDRLQNSLSQFTEIKIYRKSSIKPPPPSPPLIILHK